MDVNKRREASSAVSAAFDAGLAGTPSSYSALPLLSLFAYALFRCTIYLIPSEGGASGVLAQGGAEALADLCQSTGQCVAMVALFLFARHHPDMRLGPLATAAMLAYVATGVVLSVGAGWPVALLWGVHGAARGVAFVVLVEPFAHYPRREALVALAVCLVVCNALVLLAEGVSGAALACCVACLPLAALALLAWHYRSRGGSRAASASQAGHVPGAPANPHVASCAFVLVFAVMFARSLVNLANGDPSVPHADSDVLRDERLCEMLVAGVLVLLAFSDGFARMVRGRLFCLPLVSVAVVMAAGLAVVPFAGDAGASSPTFLTNLAGSMLILCVFWMAIEAWPSHPGGVVALLCLGRLAFKAGSLASDALGFVLESAGLSWPLSLSMTSLVAMFVLFVAVIPMLAQGFGVLDGPDGGDVPMQTDDLDAATPSSAQARERELAAYALACGLSHREAEVYALLMEGRTYPFIAERLCISPGTVSTHVDRIYKKLGVHSRQELIDLYQRQTAR